MIEVPVKPASYDTDKDLLSLRLLQLSVGARPLAEGLCAVSWLFAIVTPHSVHL